MQNNLDDDTRRESFDNYTETTRASFEIIESKIHNDLQNYKIKGNRPLSFTETCKKYCCKNDIESNVIKVKINEIDNNKKVENDQNLSIQKQNSLKNASKKLINEKEKNSIDQNNQNQSKTDKTAKKSNTTDNLLIPSVQLKKPNNNKFSFEFKSVRIMDEDAAPNAPRGKKE